MAYRYRSSQSDKTALSTHRRLTGNAAGNKGFILLYTLWILTAIAVYLAFVIKQAHNVTPSGNSQFTLAISKRQSINILQYVLSKTYSSTLKVDPRLNTYRKISQSPATDPNKNENVQFLKNLLAQMGWKIDLNKKSGGSAIGDKQTSQQPSPANDALKQGVLYAPAKKVYKLTVADTQYKIQILPIDARPNLNFLPLRNLQFYLVYLGLSQKQAKTLAYTIQDWIDEDDFSSSYGAEYNAYLSRPIPYKPRNAPIQEWGELFYLKGMQPALLALLRDNFVLHGRHKRVNAQYITPEILSGLTGLPLDTTRKYIAYQEKPTKDVTLDNILTTQDIARINSVAKWGLADKELIIVRVESAQTRLEAIFDSKRKIVLEWRFI